MLATTRPLPQNAPMKLPAPPTSLITTPQALLSVCDHLRAAQRFAFDTEFIGENTYHPILCLIQVATDDRVELIDPLALDRAALRPFWELLADPALEKICHAGDQDVEIAWLESGLVPTNMFDTQIGAGMLGITYPTALWRAVAHFTGIELEKAHTFSAWNRRPLTKDQFDYAIDDVRYLPNIHAEMCRRLDALGHMGWMRDACAEMCTEAAKVVNARELYVKIRSAASLKPQNLAVLREVVALREQLAFEANIPPRMLLKDEFLYDVALRTPMSLADLARIRDFPEEAIAEAGDELLAAVKRGLAVPETDRPTIFIPGEDSAEEKRLSETLWVAAQAICLGQQVNPALVTSQSEIAGIARAVHRDKPWDRHPLLKGWHAQCLGQKLADFIAGKIQIDLSMRDKLMRAAFA